LTFPPDFRMLPAMKALHQVGLNGRVPVPSEKRFLIRNRMEELSAVVVVGPCRRRAQRVVDALCGQTAINRMEVIVVDLAEASIPSLETPKQVSVKYIRRPDLDLWSKARCVGLREASAPIVTFTEDHCFPARDWAAALMEAHRQPWAAVGYAFTNANPRTYWSRASMVNDYGFWLHPAAPGPMTLMPGNNISYKRDVLLQYGDQLETLLTPDFNLQQIFLREGKPMCIEPAARSAHQNFDQLLPLMHANYAYARLLAARRVSAQGWTGGRRLFQAILTPIVAPILGSLRLLKSLRGREELIPPVLAGLPVYFITHAWSAIGEALGYVFGEGTSERDLNRWEIEFERGE
jgi:hypothetical protein